MAIQRREQSGLSSLSNYLKDVVRSKSLNPKNPVLIGVLQQSLISDDGNAENEDRPLPQFSHMLPYHLENAVSEVMRQYKVDLAELEVAITNHIVVEPTDVVDRIDRLEASVVQLLQVGQLFTDLASPPDQVEEWQASHAKSQHMLHTLSWRRSKLLYQALLKNDNNVTRPLRLAFEKQGAHLLIENDPEHDKQEELAGLQSLDQELQSLKERLAKQQRRGTFNEAPKQTRLQMVSDMYNLVGLSQVQSQQLGFPNVMSMEATYNHHMATIPDELFKIHHQVTEFLKPHLPKPKLTLDEEAGAFLGTRSNREGPTEDKKELWRAKQSVKNLLYLHGVLDGISEFCEAMFGIRMEVVKDGSNGGWNKNVQLIHLYETTTKSDDDHNEKDSDGGKQQKLLGTVYLEPFRDPYWRSESAQELVTTRLFSQRRFQTAVPVAIVALAVAPAWDDVPTPLTWEDTRDLLFQFGKAIQLILANQPQSTVSAPVDVSEFMATVSFFLNM